MEDQKMEFSNNSEENVTIVERVSSINEVKERMKQCIVDAISIVDGVCPQFNSFLISYSDNADIHKFVEEDSYMQVLLNQLVFDIIWLLFRKF